MVDLPAVALVAFDIDGTLTDATTWWGGEAVGWVQRYSVRDGEAILRMADRVPVLPLSRNQTEAARERMSRLRLDMRWLGVPDKLPAIPEICREYRIPATAIAFVGDGIDDALVFAKVGRGFAVADAHPRALAAAHQVLDRAGGHRVMEELEIRLFGGPP
jgi:3-deoxy-D-manno-octulosonate 8-phosphate phosphatase (KDO 8-P phosphatase)